MRAIVKEYLDKADDKLLADMTSEEQRFVQRQKPSGKRAKDKTGKFKADDPKTKDVNEAYEDGKTPKK